MTRPLRGAALIAVATLLGGCLDGSAPSDAPPSTRAPAPTATVTTYELGTPVWYAGLVVTFERAVAVLDPRGGSVTVEATLRNDASAEPISIEGPVRLVVDGEAFEPTRETDIPEVSFETTVATTIEFDVIGHGSADGAAIVIGRDGEHQPRVPLGQDGGSLAAFEPIPFDVKGTATAGQLRVRLRRAELRWDMPDWALQAPATNAILTVTYDAAFVGTFAGGFPFTGENLALRLPDGTWVRARADGHSQPILLIGAGKNKRNLQTRFEIPDGIVDELTLIVIDGKERKFLTFSLPG